MNIVKDIGVVVASLLLMVLVMYWLMITAFPKDPEIERMIARSEQTIKELAGLKEDMCHEPMTHYVIEKCK
jgi:hypothetical protein